MPFDLLIVEDEDYIRESLEVAIQWSRADCRVVAAVADPTVALEFIRNNNVDLVLSDIRMDTMDGLELCEKAQAMIPSLHFIFITGYGDMEYARKAFERHAWAFLLKPTQPEELLQTTRLLTDKLRRERREAEYLHRLEHSVAEAGPVIVQHLLRHVLTTDHPIDMDRLRRRLADAGVELTNFSIALVETSGDDRPSGFRQALTIGLVPVLAPVGGFHSVSLDSRVLSILGPADTMGKLASRMADALQQRYRIAAAIGVSSAHRTIVHASEALREAREALIEARIAIPPAVRRYRSSLSGKSNPPAPGSPIDNDQAARVYRLLDAASEGRVEEVIECVAGLEADALSKGSNLSVGFDLATRLHVLAEICLHRLGLLTQSFGLASLTLGVSPTDACALAGERLISATREARRRRQDGSSERIAIAKQFIEEHFTSNLTVVELASVCSVSPKHLSRLLKQQTGTTFSWLLAETRIRNAEVLLANPSLSIAGVAYSVGYRDPYYFSRVFKRLRGMSPAEFRVHLKATMSL